MSGTTHGVVPAKAGTHTPCRLVSAERPIHPDIIEARGYGSPPSRGRLAESSRQRTRFRFHGIRGFTLIEALVALAVVAAVLASIGSAIATTVRGTRAVDNRLAVAGAAETLLTALPSRETLQIGRQTGRTGEFIWRIDVTPLRMRDGAEMSRWRPVAVDIRMQKPDGSAFEMKTVRLIPQEAP